MVGLCDKPNFSSPLDIDDAQITMMLLIIMITMMLLIIMIMMMLIMMTMIVKWRAGKRQDCSESFEVSSSSSG